MYLVLFFLITFQIIQMTPSYIQLTDLFGHKILNQLLVLVVQDIEYDFSNLNQ